MGLLSAVFSGCIPLRASPEVLVGKWEEDDYSCSSRKAPECSQFEFYADGSFQATNFLFQLYFDVPENISGYWQVGESLGTPLDPQPIYLDIAPKGHRETIYLSFEGKLLFTDLDAGLSFYKVTN